MIMLTQICSSFICCFIAYQDFKARLISLWLLICFAIFNIMPLVSEKSYFKIIENTVFCILYFGVCYVSIRLYYLLRYGTRENILNDKIGLGDILFFFGAGMALENFLQIYFYLLAFSLGIVFYLIIGKKSEPIPLAGCAALIQIAVNLISIF